MMTLLKTYTRYGALLGAFLLCANATSAQAPISCSMLKPHDIVLALDRTGSMTKDNMSKMKKAAKELVDFIATNSPIPSPVGILVFSCDLDGCANIKHPLSTDYASVKDAINKITDDGSGMTNLQAAINQSKDELIANGTASNPDVIVLLTDGLPNRPASHGQECTNQEAVNKAVAKATNVKEMGITIMGVHYGDNHKECGGKDFYGKEILKQLVSGSEYYFNGNADLSGAFYKVGEAVACDDGLSCTIDSCDTGTLTCLHTPSDTTDSDGDGVIDCLDQCLSGNDALLGQSCQSGVGACFASGVFICDPVNFGTTCDTDNPVPSPELCNGLDDNCNGQSDEGFAVGDSCTVGIGACQVSGALVCAADGQSKCSATALPAKSEVCDGIDNDCDGSIDEDNVCACATSSLVGLVGPFDSNAAIQSKLATLIANQSVKLNKKSKKKATAYRNAVQKLYLENWHMAYESLPQKQVSCPATVSGCVSVSTAPTISKILSNSAKIVALTNAFMKKQKLTKVKKAAGRAKQIGSLHSSTEANAAGFPLSVNAC